MTRREDQYDVRIDEDGKWEITPARLITLSEAFDRMMDFSAPGYEKPKPQKEQPAKKGTGLQNKNYFRNAKKAKQNLS